MKYEELKNTIENGNNKATFRTATWTRQLKTKKDVTDVITKTTKMQVRLGVRYDNIKAVKEARANGELPAENQGLPKNCEWLDKNFIVNKVTGQISLRVANAYTGNTTTIYYKNGKIVDKAEIASLCYASETAEKQDSRDAFNIGIEKIDSLV